MQQINIEGNIIAYQSYIPNNAKGSLLFIHGSGGDHHKWDELTADLAKDLAVTALDLPGHASSPGPLLETIDDAARLISKLPGLLNLPRPVFLAGHSMGAAIAITAALDYSTYIDGIILIGSGSRLRVLPAMLEALQAGQKSPDFVRLGFSPAASETVVEAELSSYQQVPVEVLYNDFCACDKFDRSRDAAAINMPVLLITGENDKMTPVKYAQSLHDNIQNSSLEVIPQAGHYVMLEKAPEVARAIEQFVYKLC